MLKLKRNLVKNRGLTQSQVAKILECDRSTIAKYENGKRKMDQDQIC